MSGRIVLFGATGYTGRLTAEALARRGCELLLVGRDGRALVELAGSLPGEPATALADTARPGELRAVLTPDDVLLSTVGPFAQFGATALNAAIEAGATYIDSTGESDFIRDVFERHGEAARDAGSALLPAMGYDWVPGNLAGALALSDAGSRATRLEIGYFTTGPSPLLGGLSGGTRASAGGALVTPGFSFRDGRVVSERMARTLRTFEVDRKRRSAVSVGSSEHFGLPRHHPELRELDVYLGWFGVLSRSVQAFTAVAQAPGIRGPLTSAMRRLLKGSSGGPDAAARSMTGSHIVARALDADGELLAETHLEGQNGYSFTAEMLAWAAERALAGEIAGSGALGPVEAFGLVGLQRGCAVAGIRPVGAKPARAVLAG